MITITTTTPVALPQLAGELGGAALSMASSAGEYEITCHDESITEQQLEDAVAAHVPAPPPPTVEQLLQAQIDELADTVLAMGGGV